ncbi:MAG: UDP-N-acetylmuramoyl-tripeptide--D-alanyl-D-alanine ligase [Phycisphaerae bacterium]
MKAWEIEEVRRAVKGKWVTRGSRRFNGRVATDSRKVGENELFVTIVGKNHDAHKFTAETIGRGPAAILISRELAPEVVALAQAKEVALILVDDTIAALNRLAGAYRSGENGFSGMRARVIAVGGSNGKTTTKRVVHTLLAEKFGAGGVHASPKSFNNNIGMPLTLLEVEQGHDFVVLEIGTNAPGEIAALGEVCRPDIAVITNVGLEHLEQLGDLEGVAREEASIAPFGAEGGTLVLPSDAPELLQSLKSATAQRILVGREGADLMVTDVVESMGGTTFSVNGRGTFHLPLLGEHNAVNALMAIAVARRVGMTEEQIAAGLLKVKPAEMRLEPMRVGDWSVINDAYNANPSSMEAALKTYARLKGEGLGSAGRRVVVLGDMLELGPSSEAMHRSVGGMVGAWKFDLFVAVGRQMKFAAGVAEAAGVKVHHFMDTASAREGIWLLLKPADRILLKGSRGMALETVLEALRSPGVPVAV